MRYRSIDTLQKALGVGAFSYAKDPKKAAGRALGTFVELISFYLLKSWGLDIFVAIERGLPEFGNPGVTHNVEFTLHRAESAGTVHLDKKAVPYTARKIIGQLYPDGVPDEIRITGQKLISADGMLKNACTVAEIDNAFINAYLLDKGKEDEETATVTILLRRFPHHPCAMFECKRVGVEDGQKKGPQTIEKAKQGAYVARTVSSVQRFRLKDGTIAGIVEKNDGTFLIEDYYSLLDCMISGKEPNLIRDFILTIGIVSNHGNWFTSNNKNKELEVLAQSYDWLLFLTDEGLACFIEEVLFASENTLPYTRRAFFESYSREKKENRLTKSKLDVLADTELSLYFKQNTKKIAGWFNLISPTEGSLAKLRRKLFDLIHLTEPKS